MENNPVTENDCPNIYVGAATAMNDLNIPAEAFPKMVACLERLKNGFNGQATFIDIIHDRTDSRVTMTRRMPWKEGNYGFKVEYQDNNVFIDIMKEEDEEE